MQIRKRKTFLLATVLWVAIAFAGCETIQETYEDRPGATVGAGVGAATGAAAGAVFGDSAGATVVGGLLGALVGGAVGHYAYDKQQDRDETAQAIDYRPEQGTVVNVRAVSTSPDTVSPGGTVQLQTTYAVVPPPAEQSVEVREVRQILHNGQVVGSPEVTVQRSGGTYTSTVPLQLPAGAEEGVYTVRTTVETNGVRDTGETTFRVG